MSCTTVPAAHPCCKHVCGQRIALLLPFPSLTVSFHTCTLTARACLPWRLHTTAETASVVSSSSSSCYLSALHHTSSYYRGPGLTLGKQCASNPNYLRGGGEKRDFFLPWLRTDQRIHTPLTNFPPKKLINIGKKKKVTKFPPSLNYPDLVADVSGEMQSRHFRALYDKQGL